MARAMLALLAALAAAQLDAEPLTGSWGPRAAPLLVEGPLQEVQEEESDTSVTVHGRRATTTINTFNPPDTFVQSSLAYNPLGPGVLSHISMLIRPSLNITSSKTHQYMLRMKMPGFKPSGPARDEKLCDSRYKMEKGAPIDDPASHEHCLKELNGLHRVILLNPTPHIAFERFLYFDTSENSKNFDYVNMYVRADEDSGLRTNRETEATLCCFVLPISSPSNNPELTLYLESMMPGTAVTIPEASVKNSPEILRGNYWKHLQIQFDPPMSLMYAVISVRISPAQDLTDRARIIVYVPGLVRLGLDGGMGPLEFSTVGSDWLLFDFYGFYNSTETSITFQLRDGVVYPAGHKVTLRTMPGEFKLPIEMKVNEDSLMVECRSSDGVDEIIPRTAVFQSDRVPHIRAFEYSEIQYETVQDGTVTVHFIFQSNRPMFAGTKIYLKLPGFFSRRASIPLEGPASTFFYKKEANLNLPENLVTFTLNQSLYSDEERVRVGMQGMTLPPALYENDPSIVLWTSDPGAPKQSVMISPEVSTPSGRVGDGIKGFTTSEIHIIPNISQVVARIEIKVEPSIPFYQGNAIKLHLHGFSCPNEHVKLEGPDASRFVDEMGIWHQHTSTFTLIISSQRILQRDVMFHVTVPESAECVSPEKLSANDGILSIEGVGAFIKQEAIKFSPPIGRSKSITDSSLSFEPAEPRALAVLKFSFLANADILPRSTVYFKLGGLTRDTPEGISPTGEVQLSGINAPLFNGSKGFWDNDDSMLSVRVIDTVMINAGRQTSFFIEMDQLFRLPYAMYQRDPSLYLSIPEAGIKPQLFNHTTRVNLDGKSFPISKVSYGLPGEVSYPGSVTDIVVEFQPNVKLGQGSIIRIHLPGFKCPYDTVPLAAPVEDLYTSTFQVFKVTNGTVYYADWDQEKENMDFTVAKGKFVPTDAATKALISMHTAYCRLPDRLDPNDPRLTIQSITGQIIREEPIKTSDEVVGRMFEVSTLTYTPKNKLSTFKFNINLLPTVEIGRLNPIRIALPGFQNVMGKTHIHLSGYSAMFVEIPPTTIGGEDGIEAAADWDDEREILTMHTRSEMEFKAFEFINLTIEESQGFILPRTLYRNDPTLLVSSDNNIQPEPAKISPLVGDGPYEAQRYCLVQYEKGTRTRNPRCRRDPCFPPIKDPCAPRELERCLCDDVEDVPGEMIVHGFQLYAEDRLVVMPEDVECSIDESEAVRDFMIRDNAQVTPKRDVLVFTNVTSSVTGYFRLCLIHFGAVFDIGTATVRPACTPASLVMVEGICVEHCPLSKIPVAGECKTDPVALKSVDDTAIMVSMRLHQRLSDDELQVFQMSWEDPERQQFVYQFSSEMAKFLDVELGRFRLVSISNGSVIVNVVLVPAEGVLGTDEMQSRSPEGLLSMLRALQADEMSAVYENKFFQNVDRLYAPPHVRVVLCEDKEYRTICPYREIGMNSSSATMLFVALTVCGTLLLIGLCLACWTLDGDSKDTMSVESVEDGSVTGLKPEMEVEFARSWLENRHQKSFKEVKQQAKKRELQAIKQNRRNAS